MKWGDVQMCRARLGVEWGGLGWFEGVQGEVWWFVGEE